MGPSLVQMWEGGNNLLFFSLSLQLQGGFSMGGAMALHLACRYHPDVAGVYALSGFLNKDSVAFQVQHINIYKVATCYFWLHS